MTAPFQVMPALTAEEYAELRDDIRRHGITVPVVYDPEDRVVDGHHRLQIAAELGIDSEDIPWTVTQLETDEELRDLAYRLNAHRRQLSREQKRAALELSLKADPGLSNVAHAERVGVSDKTVQSVRSEMEATSEIPRSDTRQSRDGRERPVTRPSHEPCPARTADLSDPPASPASPPARRRTPLPQAFVSAVDELLRDVDRLERLIGDDRFIQNLEHVSTRNRGDLLRAAQKLAAVLTRLTATTEGDMQ